MEALTGASVGALTCYDMLKSAVARRSGEESGLTASTAAAPPSPSPPPPAGIVIRDVRLLSKRGGRSDGAAPSPLS